MFYDAENVENSAIFQPNLNGSLISLDILCRAGAIGTGAHRKS